MKLPKVLIFTAIYSAKDYCLDEFIKHAEALNYPNYRHIFIDNSADDSFYLELLTKGLDAHYVGRGNNSREAIARAQTFARRMAIEEGYDYLFSLESDVMVPSDIISNLMKHTKPVVSGVYFIGDRHKGVRVPCITIPEWNDSLQAYGTRLLNRDEFADYRNKGLQRVQAGSFGCCLIHRDIFKKIPFTYDPRFKGHSDIYFFNDCFRKQIPIYVDTDIYCDHQNEVWDNVKDR